MIGAVIPANDAACGVVAIDDWSDYGPEARAFYDAGQVSYQNKAYATGSNGQTLRGYGVGLAGVWKDFNVHAVVAWRESGKALTAPDRSPRVWVSAGWSF